jgi:hypothetical protein
MEGERHDVNLWRWRRSSEGAGYRLREGVLEENRW